MNEEVVFRNATFGGFNRKDVMEYISAATKRYQEEVRQLQEEAEQTREQLQQLLEENDRLRSQLSELEDHNNQQTVLQELKATCEAKLAETQAAYQKELALYKQDAKYYRIMRDRVGQIEMDARIHAIAVEKEADERAAQTVSSAQAKYDDIIGSIRTEAEALRSRINELLLNVSDNFSNVQSGMADSIAKAMGEVDHVHTLLLDLNSCMEEHAGAISELSVPDLPEDTPEAGAAEGTEAVQEGEEHE